MKLGWISLCLACVLSSCNIQGPYHTHGIPDEALKGIMLLRHDARLYRLGGSDESGAASARAQMMHIDGNATMAEWIDTASLPEGIRHGAALSAGDFVYVIGGETESGLLSTIYYTHIDTDGTLGFGTDKYWEVNLRALPEARARAAWILHDGWIFLIGGKTPTGPTDSIIRARIYQDGQIGQWYESSQSLPEALWGTGAAVLDDRLYVAGGADADTVTDRLVSFAFGEYGALSDRRIEPNLPAALQQVILLEDRSDLILAGGHDDDLWSQSVYRYHEGTWSVAPFTVNAEGPSFGRAAGNLFHVRRTGDSLAEPALLEGLDLAPESPVVVPGSGMVPNNSLIHVNAEPGVTLRYRENSGDTVTSADSVWPEAAIKIASATLPSMGLSLAAFSPEGAVSPTLHRNYRIRSGSLFVVIEDTLQVHEPDYPDLDRRIMQESGVGGTPPTAAASLWYRILIDSAGFYRLSWADGDDDAAYSAKLVLSVYETDLFTEVPDILENPSRDLRSGLASPLHLALNPGVYYIHIRSAIDAAGGDFGLSLLQE